jgi:hypothetical protein
MKPPEPPLPEHTATISVTGADLDRTIERLRGLGAVILSFQARGGAYTVNVILPSSLRLTLSRWTEG